MLSSIQPQRLGTWMHCLGSFLGFLKVRRKKAITSSSPCHSSFPQGLWTAQARGNNQQKGESVRASTDLLLCGKLYARLFTLTPQLYFYMKHQMYHYAS